MKKIHMYVIRTSKIVWLLGTGVSRFLKVPIRSVGLALKITCLQGVEGPGLTLRGSGLGAEERPGPQNERWPVTVLERKGDRGVTAGGGQQRMCQLSCVFNCGKIYRAKLAMWPFTCRVQRHEGHSHCGFSSHSWSKNSNSLQSSQRLPEKEKAILLPLASIL